MRKTTRAYRQTMLVDEPDSGQVPEITVLLDFKPCIYVEE